MTYIPFKDISYAQGSYDMSSNHDAMVMMKMSGGDGVTKVLYFDDQAASNYSNAKKAGKTPFMYHFYGGGDPVTEADYFLQAVSPLESGDGLALDVERGTRWDPQTDPKAVSKILAFVNHVHDKTGVWPWVYMNISTAQKYDWSPVFKNCGFWCAAPSYGFNDSLPVKYTVIAQQGSVVGGVDTNAFFGTVTQLKAYTYKEPTAPAPKPAPSPAPSPPPKPAPVPAPGPTPTPAPEPTPEPSPAPVPVAKLDWKHLALIAITAVAAIAAAIGAWLNG